MSKIVLVRHGRPHVNSQAIISGYEFGDWVDHYNAAPLDPEFAPPATLFESIKGDDRVVCSALRRSIMSAEALKIEHYEKDALFNEAQLPTIGTRLRAPIAFWLVVCRLLWFSGYSGNQRIEPFCKANVRADRCVEKLVAMTSDNSNVVFVGHGILNKLISNRLSKLGWRASVKTGSDYWGYSEYILDHGVS